MMHEPNAATRVSGVRLFRGALAVCIGATFPVVHSIAGGDPRPASVGSTQTVSTCADSGPGSLREALDLAVGGEYIDMRNLQCSVITLTTGELSTTADYLVILGSRQTTVSAGHASRVLAHHGTGQLTVVDLNFADGVVAEQPSSRGGCLYSEGSLSLSGVTIRDCLVTSLDDGTVTEQGGGVFARGSITLAYSTVRDSSVDFSNVSYIYAGGGGGGIWAGNDLYLRRSTVTGNKVVSDSVYASSGGFYAGAGAYISYSTIDNNVAPSAGAGEGAWSIVSSTISGNSGGGLSSRSPLVRVWYSTIAFNTEGAGLDMTRPRQYLVLRNSIVADNTVDVDVLVPFYPVIGSNNLVITSNIPLPSDTIRIDPMLSPLSDNGGLTRTHALVPGSPAIDRGHVTTAPYDQRGPGYDRTIGVAPDIGAFELQEAQPPPEPIFADGFD